MGAFSYDASRNSWTQPRHMYNVVIFEHSGCLTHNGTAVPFRKGGLFVIAPGATVSFETFDEPSLAHVFASFSPADSSRDVVAIPMFTQLSTSEFDVFTLMYRRALNRNRETRTTYLSAVWSTLWAIAKPLSEVKIDPYVAEACRIIDERIGGPITVAALSQEVFLSHNQLIRKFQDETGRPPARYIRERRAELAREQLTRTTRPIKEIAASVGVPDLHEFNRLMRRCTGISPRHLRNERLDMDYFRAKEYGLRNIKD
ncbi:hypothetical protein BH11ARM1_BH11ARM1_09310 [soil metagenome]